MKQIQRLIYTRQGILHTIISGLAYGCLGIFTQLNSSVHTLESSTVRGLFLSLLSSIVLIAGKIKPICSKGEFFWIMANASSGTAVQITLFMAYGLSPAGDVNAIVYSSPLFSGILARMFLKEKLAGYDIILTLVSIAGVFLISRPVFVFGAPKQSSEVGDPFIGTLWAIGALFFYSIQPVIARKLGLGSTDATILTLTFGILAFPVSAILNSFIGEWAVPADIKEIAFLLGVGISGFLGIQFLSLALRTEKAVFVTLGVTLTTIIITYVLQVLIFQVYPDIISAVGIVLITGATIVALVIKWRESKEADVQLSIDSKSKDATTQTEHSFDNPAIHE